MIHFFHGMQNFLLTYTWKMWYSIKSIYSGKGWIIPAYAIIAMLIIFGTPNVFMYVFLTIILYYVIRSILIEELISFAKEVKIRKKKKHLRKPSWRKDRDKSASWYWANLK